MNPTRRFPAAPARRHRRPAAVVAAWVAASMAAAALGPLFSNYATAVFSASPGFGATGDPTVTLGAPAGGGLYAGSTDTYSLGVGGELVLELGLPAYDGPGTDLLVCENPFYVNGTTLAYAEAVFVEVSTDGTTFARFPTRFVGPPGPYSPFQGLVPAWFSGFAGAMPVLVVPATGGDPLDIVSAGGDAFDFADLASEPAVLSGAVDLDDVRYVKLVDAVAGQAHDSQGTLVWDVGFPTLDSADIDALVAVHNQGSYSSGRPAVEASLVAGLLTISVHDPDGFADIKAGLKASVDGIELPFGALLPYFAITEVDPTGFTLATGPVVQGAFQLVLKVGARDKTGLAGGDALVIQ